VNQVKPHLQDPAKRQQKLQKRLRRDVGRAIDDYAMIEQGDKVTVCVWWKRLLCHAWHTHAATKKCTYRFWNFGS